MDHSTSGEAEAAGGRVPPKPGSSFLAGLAQAIRASLARERARIDATVANEAKDHAANARARATLEADELRRLTEDEIGEIEAWVASEIKKVRREARRRTKERRADMASYLERHNEIVDSEIAGVESAVAEYSSTLERFMAELVATEDPTEIAHRAALVPMPPDMDEIRARARAHAVAAYDRSGDGPHLEDAGTADVEPAIPDASEPASDPGVAVMDPEADGRPADIPLAVDPLHIPEDEPAAAAEPPAPDQETTDANGGPTGAFRFFRSLVPWPAAPDVPHGKDREARRS